MKSAGYEAIVNTKRIWMVLVLVMNRLYGEASIRSWGLIRVPLFRNTSRLTSRLPKSLMILVLDILSQEPRLKQRRMGGCPFSTIWLKFYP